MTIQCCRCHRVKDEENWTYPACAPGNDEVSHGFCPACLEDARAELAESERLFKARLCRAAAATETLGPAFNS